MRDSISRASACSYYGLQNESGTPGVPRRRFNWTHDLQSVWSDPVFQVDELHKTAVDRIMDDFLLYTKSPSANPIGRVVLGEAGAGKTHLIGTLRRRVWQAHGWFVLLDIVGITDFWATTALGFVNSLHQPMTCGQTQYQAVLSAIVNRAHLDSTTQKVIAEWKAKPDNTKLDKARREGRYRSKTAEARAVY